MVNPWHNYSRESLFYTIGGELKNSFFGPSVHLIIITKKVWLSLCLGKWRTLTPMGFAPKWQLLSNHQDREGRRNPTPLIMGEGIVHAWLRLDPWSYQLCNYTSHGGTAIKMPAPHSGKVSQILFKHIEISKILLIWQKRCMRTSRNGSWG